MSVPPHIICTVLTYCGCHPSWLPTLRRVSTKEAHSSSLSSLHAMRDLVVHLVANKSLMTVTLGLSHLLLLEPLLFICIVPILVIFLSYNKSDNHIDENKRSNERFRPASGPLLSIAPSNIGRSLLSLVCNRHRLLRQVFHYMVQQQSCTGKVLHL